MKKLFTVINTVLVAGALAISLAAQTKNDRPQVNRPDANKMQVLQKVAMTCKNPGSHQDVAKTPDITNSTGKLLKKGAKVNWTSSDGDKGTITLDKDLAAGASVRGLGSAGQSYTCQAWTMQ